MLTPSIFGENLFDDWFDDKGNYSYTVGEQITVSGVEKE